MTTHVLGASRRWAAVGVNHTGIVLGSLSGAMHLGWVVLVAAGVAQPVTDFVFWLHFIRPVWVIQAFEPLRAVGLVVLTASIGYVTGAAFALIWNHLHRVQT